MLYGIDTPRCVTVTVKLASNCMPTSISIDRIKPIVLKDWAYREPVELQALRPTS